MTGLSRSEGLILSAVKQRGQITRTALAAEVDLSLAMTTRIIARLQDLGLLREAGHVDAAGPGRHAALLEVRPDCAHVLGVDIGTELIHILIADLRGQPLFYREVSSDALAHLPQAQIVRALAQLLREALSGARVRQRSVAAVGVALTGIVDSERGVSLLRSNTPGWEDFPLAALLSEALALPVLLEETARAKSLAEAQIGIARGREHFLYVDAGAAIGASLVIDRRPFRGVSGLAGELGHVTVDPAGALCRCGNRGCVQAVASARALVRGAREAVDNGVYSSLAALGDQIALHDIAAAAATGDKLALTLLTEAGERLGEAIGMALNILGLDLVVLGGALIACSPVVLDTAARTVQLRVLPLVPRRRSLLASELGTDSAARGAVLQAIDWLFEVPGERLLPYVAQPGTQERAAG